MTSASAALCLTRKTPPHSPCALRKAPKWARHRPEIGSDKNPILLRGEGQHFGVGNSFKLGHIGRKEIDCRLTAETPGDDRTVETGICQEADYQSASPRECLLPHSLKRLFHLGRRRVGCGESILLALAFRNVSFHLFPTS